MSKLLAIVAPLKAILITASVAFARGDVLPVILISVLFNLGQLGAKPGAGRAARASWSRAALMIVADLKSRADDPVALLACKKSVQQSCFTHAPDSRRKSAATLGISFLLWARLLRFALIREGQYRERSSWSKPLVKASIEPFDQFVDDLEPASPLNVCWS
jgi:hypothetical protein